MKINIINDEEDEPELFDFLTMKGTRHDEAKINNWKTEGESRDRFRNP